MFNYQQYGLIEELPAPQAAAKFFALWDWSNSSKPKAITADSFGVSEALRNPNPSKPFNQELWENGTKGWNKAVGEAVSAAASLYTPNPSHPFSQAEWSTIKRVTAAKITDLTNLDPLYTTVVVVYPFSQYNWAAATPAQQKLNYDSVYPSLAIYSPNPTRPFSQTTWERISTRSIPLIVEQVPIFNLPAPIVVTTLPHNLPFHVTMGKLRSF